MTLESARFAWEIFVSLVAGLSALYTWSVGRDKEWRRQLVDLSAGIEKHIDSDGKTHRDLELIAQEMARRVAILEECNRHAPNARDVLQLRDAIAQLAQSVAGQAGAMKALEHMVARMNDFLLERGS